MRICILLWGGTLTHEQKLEKEPRKGTKEWSVKDAEDLKGERVAAKLSHWPAKQEISETVQKGQKATGKRASWCTLGVFTQEEPSLEPESFKTRKPFVETQEL